LLKYKTVQGKLAGRIGTLRGPDLARGPDFRDRWFTTTVVSFLHGLKGKHGSEVATQTFHDRKVTLLTGESLIPGCDVTMTSGAQGNRYIFYCNVLY